MSSKTMQRVLTVKIVIFSCEYWICFENQLKILRKSTGSLRLHIGVLISANRSARKIFFEVLHSYPPAFSHKSGRILRSKFWRLVVLAHLSRMREERKLQHRYLLSSGSGSRGYKLLGDMVIRSGWPSPELPVGKKVQRLVHLVIFSTMAMPWHWSNSLTTYY